MSSIPQDQQVKRLEWDSQFFGFEVGTASLSEMNAASFQALKEDIQKQGVHLTYLALNQPIDEVLMSPDQDWAILHVDKKTTYFKQIAIPPEESVQLESVSEQNLSDAELAKLYALAPQSGAYSRYKVDPNIGAEKFDKMFALWMKNSLNRTIAKDVLIQRIEGEIAGFVTVGEKAGQGSIGIIAVDTSFRGKGIGKSLIQMAEARLAQLGYSELQVVTQGDNTAACRFYESAGFVVQSVLHYYHIWQNNNHKGS